MLPCPQVHPDSQSYGISSSHMWMWELDHKEAQCQRIDAFTLWCWRRLLRFSSRSPWTAEIKPVHRKGNQPWILSGQADAEAEAPILWPPDVKNWLIGKDPDAGKDWRQEEKGTTEDETVGCHHWLDGHEFEQAPGKVKDREAWCGAVRGVTKSGTWLSDWTTTWWVVTSGRLFSRLPVPQSSFICQSQSPAL